MKSPLFEPKMQNSVKGDENGNRNASSNQRDVQIRKQ